MQERYLGDDKDYVKFALLRHLHRDLGVCLGMNWYLTDPHVVGDATKKDGEQRHGLDDNPWSNYDSDLCTRLCAFDQIARRQIAEVKNLEILPPGMRDFAEHVPLDGRDAWFGRSQKDLAAADLVFLDPDNGFETQSMTRRKAPKYALFSEAISYLHAGKIVVGIQFVGRIRLADRVQRTRDRLTAEGGSLAAHLPVIRGRLAPNVLFFALAPEGITKSVARSLISFADAAPMRRTVRHERLCQIVH